MVGSEVCVGVLKVNLVFLFDLLFCIKTKPNNTKDFVLLDMSSGANVIFLLFMYFPSVLISSPVSIVLLAL